MKLSALGLVGVLFGAVVMTGCAERGLEAKAPTVGTTTVTAAPVEKQLPRMSMLPAIAWDDDKVVEVVETWGARPPTPEELEKYGF